MRTRSEFLALALMLAPVAVQAAPAQPIDPDPRWQAFLGCWAPITQDGVEAVPAHVLCFSERESGAVAATTIADGEVQGEELIVANGSARAVQEEACSGTQSARWSEDGARVYLRSALTCGENVLGRESAGVLALSGGGTFIDVQAVGVDDQYGVRVLQYRALAPAEYPAAMRTLAAHADDATRLYAAAPLSLDDIVEASSALPPAAVQAMLINLPASRIHVDADALLALADAGVAEEVIDVVVALAHPEKFAVAVATASLDGEKEAHAAGRTVWMRDPYNDAWSRYGSYGRYGYYPYSRFGFNSYGWGYGGGGGTVIIIDRDDVDNTDDGRGAAVKGRGYTRVGGDRASEPRSTSRSQPSAGRSSGGSSSTASPSRGSSGSGSSRKAQPKKPPPDGRF